MGAEGGEGARAHQRRDVEEQAELLHRPYRAVPGLHRDQRAWVRFHLRRHPVEDAGAIHADVGIEEDEHVNPGLRGPARARRTGPRLARPAFGTRRCGHHLDPGPGSDLGRGVRGLVVDDDAPVIRRQLGHHGREQLGERVAARCGPARSRPAVAWTSPRPPDAGGSGRGRQNRNHPHPQPTTKSATEVSEGDHTRPGRYRARPRTPILTPCCACPSSCLDPDLPLPTYARAGRRRPRPAGREDAVVAAGGGRALVPDRASPWPSRAGHAGFVLPRSGLALRHGLTVAERARPRSTPATGTR